MTNTSPLLTNHMRAVILIVALALRALQARPYLRTYADTVADLDRLDLVSDFDGVSDDLVADRQGKRGITPAAVDGVYV